MQPYRRRIGDPVIQRELPRNDDRFHDRFTQAQRNIEREIHARLVELNSTVRCYLAFSAARRRAMMTRIILMRFSLSRILLCDLMSRLCDLVSMVTVATGVCLRLRRRFRNLHVSRFGDVRMMPATAEHGVHGDSGCDGK